MATIPIQTTSLAGLSPTFQAATASDTITGVPSNEERLTIRAKNTNVAAATITINPVAPLTVKVPMVGPQAVAPISVNVPANTGDVQFGPIPSAYIDATGTITLLNGGTITNLTIAAIRVPPMSI
jgi:hypothetical protein